MCRVLVRSVQCVEVECMYLISSSCVWRAHRMNIVVGAIDFPRGSSEDRWHPIHCECTFSTTFCSVFSVSRRIRCVHLVVAIRVNFSLSQLFSILNCQLAIDACVSALAMISGRISQQTYKLNKYVRTEVDLFSERVIRECGAWDVWSLVNCT